MIVEHDLTRRFVHLEFARCMARRTCRGELGAYFLKARCERCDLLFLFRKLRLEGVLLVGDCRLQLFHFAVFFEELVEQHGASC